MNTSEEQSTPRHPIRVVAERTGVTPNLLRAWERRYTVVQPDRSEGGQRLYSDADVERLLLLRKVVDAGRAIGSVADLSVPELQALVVEDEQARSEGPGSGAVTAADAARDEAFSLVRALDPDALEQLLRREVVALGGEVFLDRVVAPLLVTIGTAWRTGTLRPAHEHVAVAVIKQVLGWMMESARSGSARRVLVTGTLTGEKHEVGALLAGTAAALEGWKVVFLGEDLPAEEVVLTVTSVNADAVGISVVNPGDWDEAVTQMKELAEFLPKRTALIVGGAAGADLAREVDDTRLRTMSSMDQFRATLRSLN